MNTNTNISYQKSLQLFKKHQYSLPQNIKWKLNYITSIISGLPTEKAQNLSELYQLQINDLKDVNQKGLKIIFCSIIQTLFNQQIPIDRQCLIRKKGFFKSWSDGFIKYDYTYIYFNTLNKTGRYRFKNVDIKLNSKSKRSFDFFYKGEQMMTIKFQKPESMNLMYKTIKSLIYSQKNKYDQQLKHNFNTLSRDKQNNMTQKQQKNYNQIKQVRMQNQNNNLKYNYEKKKNQQKNMKDSKIKQNINLELNKKFSSNQTISKQKNLQFQKSFISEQQNALIIRNSKRDSREGKQLKLNPVPQNYFIKMSSKNMFIALCKEEVKLNLQVILQRPDNIQIHQIVSCLATYINWSSKILKEQECFHFNYQNKAIIYRVYQKSSSILSKQRQTYTIQEFKKINRKQDSALLLQQSLENEDKPQQFIRAYLKSIFFIQIYLNQLKISIDCQYDPKGYCTFNQSQQLLFSIYKDIVHFENYLNEYCIKKQKQPMQLLFEEMKIEDQNQQMPQNLRLKNSQSQQNIAEEKSSDQQQRNSRKTSLQIYRRSTKRQPFIQLKGKNPNWTPTLQYLELIRKREYQRYYLRHHFQSKCIIEYQKYFPWYCLQQLLNKGGEYQITEKFQLHFINQKLISSQKDILRFVLRQIGANLISGKSVLNVSLPVDIFQPRTLLQRSAASLGKCPDYLLRSFNLDPLQQIKNVSAFLATVPTLELIMRKPFNPILGQTFQCYLKGVPLCYQQISHHPPISSYYMECSQFKLYGNLVAFADVGLNSGVGGNLGALHIIFKNGYHYECYFPPSQISGLIYGDRKFRSYGKGYIIQRSQKLFAEFSIQKTKKGIYESKDKLFPGSIIGGIFKVNDKFIQFLNGYKNNLKKFPGISKEHIVQKLVHINGIWFDKIYMNEKDITEGVRAYPVQYYPYSLPSDANFRLDVIYHKQNNLPQSQKEKQVLENIQREDRKLREKFEKQNKK